MASEVDLLPTIAGLASTPHLNSTLGRDLLAPGFDGRRGVFLTDDPGRVRWIGLLNQEFYFTRQVDGSRRSLHRLASESPLVNRIDEHPDVIREMEEFCCAYYETARSLAHFNSPAKIAAGGVAKAGLAR
jgi:hypothetical protein